MRTAARKNHPMRRWPGGATGTSLVEILVAFALLAMAALPLWYMFSMSARTIVAGQYESLIQNLGTAFCSQVRRFYPSLVTIRTQEKEFTLNANGLYPLDGPSTSTKVALPSWEGRPVKVFYTAESLTSLPRQNRLITLIVKWQSRAGKDMESRFPELIANE